LTYRQYQETSGSGINARFGVIFRPVSNFRLGATLQTPTWLSIEDRFSESIDNRLNQDLFKGNTHDFPFAYRLRTPMKGSLGASYVIGNSAIISADVDFVDYASTRFSLDDNNYDPETINANNADIRANYKQAVNFRLGGEYKIDKINLRAGYGINGSPLKG